MQIFGGQFSDTVITAEISRGQENLWSVRGESRQERPHKKPSQSQVLGHLQGEVQYFA